MKNPVAPNRRQFIRRAAAASISAISAPSLFSAQSGGGRQIAPRSRRRIIWNNDGDDMRFVAFGIPRLWTARGANDVPLPERFSSIGEYLDLRMTPLRQSPVDTISFCGVFNWPAWELPRGRIEALGADPVKAIVDFTHDCGKEFFFNIRMNDCHSSRGFHSVHPQVWEDRGRWVGSAWWEPFRLQNLHLIQSKIPSEELERRYLPWIRGESSDDPLADVRERRGPGNRDVQSWSAYDYVHPKVREYYLGLVKQACDRYELDGIDLDWLRHPYFFNFGQERRNIPLMNDFVRQIAAIVRATSRERGRNISLSMRVPDSPGKAMDVGLDVGSWIREGWVDILVAGNGITPYSVPFQPWIDLAAPHGIPVYGCITRNVSGLDNPAGMRGACWRLWKSGVTGIYFFNHFIPEEYGTIADAADMRRLADLTKYYQVDRNNPSWQNGTVHLGPLPVDFSTCAGEALLDLKLEIPESVKTASRVVFLVSWQGRNAEPRTNWMINGKKAEMQGRTDDNMLVYDGNSLISGMNKLRVSVAPGEGGAAQPLVLQAVRAVLERS